MTSILAQACGVADGASDEAVVGVLALPGRKEISDAIDIRLRAIAAHPNSQGPRGVEARARVVQAARRLMRDALARERESAERMGARGKVLQKPPSGTATAGVSLPDGTTRELAAILRAAGGWNERSRQRVMAWARHRRLSADQLRLAFTKVIGARARGPSRREADLPAAAMEGLAASIDVVIDPPRSSRWVTAMLVVAGALLSLTAGIVAWNAMRAPDGSGDAQPTVRHPDRTTADRITESDVAVAAGPGVDGVPENGAGSAGQPGRTERESNAPHSEGGGGDASTAPTPAPVVIHRDDRVLALLAQWNQAARSTWELEQLPASPLEVIARLERTHALLEAASSIEHGQLESAAGLLQSTPASPARLAVRPVLPTVETADSILSSSLKQAGQAASSRRRALEQFAREGANRIGPENAAALATAAFSDESVDVRSLAQRMVLEQFVGSRAMTLAMVNALPLALPAREREAREFVERYLQESCDVPTARWRAWATRALADRALHDISAVSVAIDRRAETLRATVGSRAVVVGASPSEVASARTAEECAALVLAKLLAKLLAEAPASEQQGHARALALRIRAADGPPQRFEAVQWTMVEVTASGIVSRWPAEREAVGRIVEGATRSRDGAATILEQLASDARALLALTELRLHLQFSLGGKA
ncbi:MAG: hypothetical protein O2819_07615 [Planctomycetota bacterium]|nr:hypothetical protein [Planctomycetota bacterium]